MKAYILIIISMSVVQSLWSQLAVTKVTHKYGYIQQDGKSIMDLPKNYIPASHTNLDCLPFLRVNILIKKAWQTDKEDISKDYKIEIINHSSLTLSVNGRWSTGSGGSSGYFTPGSTTSFETTTDEDYISFNINDVEIKIPEELKSEYPYYNYTNYKRNNLDCHKYPGDIMKMMIKESELKGKTNNSMNNQSTPTESHNSDPQQPNSSTFQENQLNTNSHRGGNGLSENASDNDSSTAFQETEAERLAREDYERGEQIRKETEQNINELNAAYDQFGDDLGAELGDIFSGELKPQNIINITESLLNSGLLNTVDGIAAASLGGGLAAAGVGLLQEAKQAKMDKIKDASESLQEDLDAYQDLYKSFQSAVDQNNETELLTLHSEISLLENDIISNSEILIDKAKKSELRDLIKNINDSYEKRSKGVLRVKNKMFASFHALPREEKVAFINSNSLSPEDIAELKTPSLREGYARYYYDNWTLKVEGGFKNQNQEGIWKLYDEEQNLKAQILYNENYPDYLLEYYPSGKIKGVESLEKYQSFYENGNTNTIGNMVNPSKNPEEAYRTGIWAKYLEDGSINTLMEYDKNVADGKQITFYPNGNKDYEVNYKVDQRDGIANWYHTNGQLQKVVEYKYSYNDADRDFMGLRWNALAAFSKEGTPLDKGNLTNGNGVLIEYDSLDTMEKFSTFKNGYLKKQLTNPKKIAKAYQSYLKKNPNGAEVLINLDTHVTYHLEEPNITEDLKNEVLSQFSQNQTKNSNQSKPVKSKEKKEEIKNEEISPNETSNKSKSHESLANYSATYLMSQFLDYLGGVANMQKITSIKLVSNISMTNNYTNELKMKYTEFREMPNLYRSEMEIPGIENATTIQKFDGKKGYIISGNNKVPMDENSIENFKNSTHIITALDQYQLVLQHGKNTLKEVNREGVTYLSTIYTLGNQTYNELFFDPNTQLLMRWEMTPTDKNEQYSKTIIEFQDYQHIGDSILKYAKHNTLTTFDTNNQVLVKLETTIKEVDENADMSNVDF